MAVNGLIGISNSIGGSIVMQTPQPDPPIKRTECFVRFVAVAREIGSLKVSNPRAEILRVYSPGQASIANRPYISVLVSRVNPSAAFRLTVASGIPVLVVSVTVPAIAEVLGGGVN